MKQHRCDTCTKELSSYKSLWRHKQKCERYGPPDDMHEVCVGQKRKVHGEYIAALDRIVNSPRKTSPAHAISKIPVLSSREVESGIDSTTRKASGLRLSRGYGVDEDDDVRKKRKKGETAKKQRRKTERKATKKQRSKTEQKAVKLLGELVKDLETNDDDETSDEDDEKEKLEKAQDSFIDSRIRKPKKKLMKLLKELEKDVDIGDLKSLVKAFLESEEKTIDQKLQNALAALGNNSRSFEIGMLLREIEKLNNELAYILYRLKDSDLTSLPDILQQLEREKLISKEVKEKLLEKPYTFLQMVDVVKDTDKTGSGVTQYLPSSLHEMWEKLELLYGELKAGNRAVIPQIVALVGKLHQKGQLSYKDYKYFCEQTGSCAQY